MRFIRAALLAPLVIVISGFGAGPGSTASPAAQHSAEVVVHLDRSNGTIDPLIYGHLTEETLTSWEGGVSSEMLVDRKFSVPEERFPLSGTGGGWEPIELASTVTLVQDQVVYYSAPMSQRISNAGGSVPAGVQQRGYHMTPPQMSRQAPSGGVQVVSQRTPEPFHFRTGEHFRARIAIKNRDLNGSVFVAIGEDYKHTVAKHAIDLAGGEDWKVYQFELAATADANDAKFMIFTESRGTVWVDSASFVRRDLDEGGFRKDVLEATRRLRPSNVRWPGGWFVSDYHWQDGIGPVDERRAQKNRAWGGYYNNDIGVDEYLAYCRAVGTEPYIVVNVGTGSPEEAAALVEYVNGPATSKWGRLRAQAGHRESYNVRLWGIGNEEYLPILGATSGRTYAANYLEFVRAMRNVDPKLQFVAVGMFELPKGFRPPVPPGNPFYNAMRYATEWGDQFFPAAGHDTDYYSIHYYEPGDSMKGEFAAEDFQRAAMVISENLERKLGGVFNVMAKHQVKIPIALDEWRLSVPGNTPLPVWLDVPESTTMVQVGSMGSASSMLSAVSEATIYNLMQRRPAEFRMSNRTLLYAYLGGDVGDQS